MPKRKKLKPIITRIEESPPLDKFTYGDTDLIHLVNFKDEDEATSFYRTLDLCVEQDESTNGIAELVNPTGRAMEEGDEVLLELVLNYKVKQRITLSDIRGTLTKEDFEDAVTKELLQLNKACENGCESNLVDLDSRLHTISSKLFDLNANLSKSESKGTMMTLLANLCSLCIHFKCTQQKLQARREKLAMKLKAINALINAGLVTGSKWSSAAFWESLKTQLQVEYDSIPQKSLFSPFNQTFILLKQLVNVDNQIRTSLFNSILYLMDTFKLFNLDSGYTQNFSRVERRRQITDRFENLPDQIPDPGFNLYRPQQKTE